MCFRFFSYSGPNEILQHIFDVTYQLFVVIILVALITGIIIGTFQELSNDNAAMQEDIANICFICSVNRQVFERNLVKFHDHINVEHNPWNYLVSYGNNF